jgi:hypothetical protein
MERRPICRRRTAKSHVTQTFTGIEIDFILSLINIVDRLVNRQVTRHLVDTCNYMTGGKRNYSRNPFGLVFRVILAKMPEMSEITLSGGEHLAG